MSAAFDPVSQALRPFLLVSGGGLWLLFNGSRGRGWIFAPGLDAPRWFLILCGILMQLPLAAFLFLGYQNGIIR